MEFLLFLTPIVTPIVGDDVSKWAMENGLAVVLLFVCILATWKILSWLAVNVVIPIRDTFIVHLRTTDSTMVSTQQTMQNMQQTLLGISEEMKVARNVSEESRQAWARVHDRLDRLEKS